MRNLCDVPLSSNHFHVIVPIMTLLVLEPPKPLMMRPLGSGGPSKSSITDDMHAEHRLSIPTAAESVSNTACLGECFTVAAIAMAQYASIFGFDHRLRFGVLICLLSSLICSRIFCCLFLSTVVRCHVEDHWSRWFSTTVPIRCSLSTIVRQPLERRDFGM